MKFPKNENTTTEELEPTVKVDLSSVIEQTEKEAAMEKAYGIAWNVLSPVLWIAIGFAGCLWLVARVNQ